MRAALGWGDWEGKAREGWQVGACRQANPHNVHQTVCLGKQALNVHKRHMW